MLIYPVTLIADTNGEQLVDFVDFPNAHGAGDTEAEALASGVDALITAIEMLVEDRRTVPLPSPVEADQHVVALPALETAKVLLWNEMLAQKWRKADLAREMGAHPPQIDRLFDMRHSSKVDQVELAAKALGRSLNVELV